MATATVVKPRNVAKATKAHRYAALRLMQVQQAATRFKQVGDPTRLQIVLLLAEGEKHAGGICEAVDQSQATTSYHLALLRHSGIIALRRQGQNNFYALTEAGEQLASIVKNLVG